MDITPEIQNKIELLLAGFRFHRIVTAMKAVGWKWGDNETGNFVYPTEEQVRKRARELLADVIEKGPNYMVSSGGLHAYVDAEGDIGLEFTLDAIDTSDMEYLRYLADKRRLAN